jgi:Ca2+-dependent lipid-binding protein
MDTAAIHEYHLDVERLESIMAKHSGEALEDIDTENIGDAMGIADLNVAVQTLIGEMQKRSYRVFTSGFLVKGALPTSILIATEYDNKSQAHLDFLESAQKTGLPYVPGIDYAPDFIIDL